MNRRNRKKVFFLAVVFVISVLLALMFSGAGGNTAVALGRGILFLLVFGGVAWAIYRRYKLRRENARNYAQTQAMRADLTQSAWAQQYGYDKKKSLMTDCEKAYFASIVRTLPPGYICLPQIPLSAVVEKTGGGRQGELNRVLDFCIVDEQYTPLLAIEINDRTHETYKRRERDRKVKTICSAAGLPLITAWTFYGVNDHFFVEQFGKYLNH